MDKKFYGGNGRNSSDYGHNRNVQPMIEATNGQISVRLAVAFALLLFIGLAGTSVIVAFG